MPIDAIAYLAAFGLVAGAAFSNSVFEIFSTAFAIGAILTFRRTAVRAYSKPLLALVALYLGAVVASMFGSEHLSASARGFVKVLQSVSIFLAAIYLVRDDERFGKLYAWILWVGAIVAADALLQTAIGHDLLRNRPMTAYFGDTMRVTGPFRHANDFSAYLSFTFFAFAGLLAEWGTLSRRGRVIAIAGTALLGLCLVWTYARGAWIAVGVAAALLAVYRRNKWAIGTLILAALWAFFFSPPLVRDRVRSLADTRNGTILERKALWGEAIRMIEARPVLGHGINTYAKNEPKFKEGANVDNQYAHNGYLHLAAETGLVGLAAFLALVVYALGSCLEAFAGAPPSPIRAAGTALAFGLVAFLFHSATDTDLHSVLLVNAFWFGLGLCWAARNGVLARPGGTSPSSGGRAGGGR